MRTKNTALCIVNECGRPVKGRGYCATHHHQVWRGMNPAELRVIRPPALEERFWAKVEKTSSCWLWTSARTPGGYGLFTKSRRDHDQVYAHRLAYELMKGKIPAGMQIDHLCFTPSCVNPDHLEAVTPRENVLRAFRHARLKRLLT